MTTELPATPAATGGERMGADGDKAIDRRIALILFVLLSVLYVSTLCRTVYFGDSGEISAAIATGGIIHPPGYPLLGLLGRLFLVLIPVGEPAFRIGVVVALAAAGAVCALFYAARALGSGRAASVGAALLLGASFTFWSQSERVEVYSLNALFALIAIGQTIAYRKTGALRPLLIACGAIGLGISHHLTIVLLLPGLLLIAGPRLWTDPGVGRRIGLGIAVLCLCGAPLYLLLVVWSKADPIQNWGAPDNAKSLFYHVSAKLYQGTLMLPVGAKFVKASSTAWSIARESQPFWVWMLCLPGIALGFRRAQQVTAGLLVCAATVTAYNFCYQIPDLAGYYIPVLAIAMLLGSFSIDSLLSRVERFGIEPSGSDGSSPRSLRLTWLFALAPGLALVGLNYRVCDLSRVTAVRDMAIHKLESCDRDAILIIQGDPDAFPIFYVNEVLGVRSDVVPVGREMVMGVALALSWEPKQWYLRRLRKRGLDVPLIGKVSDAEAKRLAFDGYLKALLAGPLKDRPLFTTFLGDSPDAAERMFSSEGLVRWYNERYVAYPQGLVVALAQRDRAPDLAGMIRKNQAIWKSIDLPDLDNVVADQEISPDYLPRHYVVMLINYGFLYERMGNQETAEKVYSIAREWSPALAADVLAPIVKNRPPTR